MPQMKEKPLSAREKAVLTHLASGLGYKEISEEMGIAIDTVRKHLQNAYRKLDAKNSAEAVAKALRTGAIE